MRTWKNVPQGPGAETPRGENDGAVVIGDVSTPAGYKLYVQGGLLTEQVKVAIKTTNDWSDFVFDKQYPLMPLGQLEKYIAKHKHLPHVPGAEEMVSAGLDMAKMDATLLRKVEELTLYILEQEMKIQTLQRKIATLEVQK